MSVLVKTKSLYDRLLTRIYLGIFMLRNWVFWLLYDSFQLFENGGCLKNLYLEKKWSWKTLYFEKVWFDNALPNKH